MNWTLRITPIIPQKIYLEVYGILTVEKNKLLFIVKYK